MSYTVGSKRVDEDDVDEEDGAELLPAGRGLRRLSKMLMP